MLKKAGHNISILDINASRINKIEVEQCIKENRGIYHCYGISGLITTYKYQKWLIQTIAKYTDAYIFCGGGCASTAGDLLLKAGADEVIPGAGENRLPDFMSKLRYNNIDELPFPDWWNLPMETYLQNPIWGSDAKNSSGIHPDMKQERSANTVTSRGCPYSCNFCYDPFGRAYQQRSIWDVTAEVQQLKDKYNIDFIGFVDDNMFVNRGWVLNFCEAMSEQNILWGCHARVNEVDSEVLKAAYDSGCRWIGYGIESGSQTILNNMNKGTTEKQSGRAISLTRKYNIYPNTTFIYGYPGENAKTVKETIEFCIILGLKPEFFYATPYPMTQLYNTLKSRILAHFGGFEKYVEALGDAKDFLINLTDMPDKYFFALRETLIGELN